MTDDPNVTGERYLIVWGLWIQLNNENRLQFKLDHNELFITCIIILLIWRHAAFCQTTPEHNIWWKWSPLQLILSSLKNKIASVLWLVNNESI